MGGHDVSHSILGPSRKWSVWLLDGELNGLVTGFGIAFEPPNGYVFLNNVEVQGGSSAYGDELAVSVFLPLGRSGFVALVNANPERGDWLRIRVSSEGVWTVQHEPFVEGV